MTTEVIENMPFDKYLKLDRLSSSALKDYIQAPAYYKWRKKNPMKKTENLKLGTMVHTWVLENSTFNNLYMGIPKLDKRTKKGKDAYAAYVEQANGRILMDEEIIHKYTKNLKPYNDTKNEVTVLFELQGIPCKARFDCLRDNGVEDLKTIADIFKIDKRFAQLKYYIQAGFYSEAYKAAFGVWPDFFKFTFISTGEYFDVVTREISFEYLEYGRMEANRHVSNFKYSVENDYWPGIQPSDIEMPSWM